MQVRARFDGKVFVPVDEVDLPAGVICEFEPRIQPEARLKLSDLAASMPSTGDVPTDLAAQVDHYLYGTPKRP